MDRPDGLTSAPTQRAGLNGHYERGDPKAASNLAWCRRAYPAVETDERGGRVLLHDDVGVLGVRSRGAEHLRALNRFAVIFLYCRRVVKILSPAIATGPLRVVLERIWPRARQRYLVEHLGYLLDIDCPTAGSAHMVMLIIPGMFHIK